MLREVWKTIRGYEGYEVSNLGRVRSVNREMKVTRVDPRTGKSVSCCRHYRGRLLKLIVTSNGYLVFNAGRNRPRSVQKFVLRAFVGDRKGLWGLHRDDNKLNNRLDNLYWGTPDQNSRDADKNGRLLRGERIGNSKLKEKDVLRLRRQSSKICDYGVLSERLGVHKSTVRRAVLGLTWSHL